MIAMRFVMTMPPERFLQDGIIRKRVALRQSGELRSSGFARKKSAEHLVRKRMVPLARVERATPLRELDFESERVYQFRHRGNASFG